MQLVLLPPRLNYQLRATAASVLVRSTISVPTAATGVVQLAVSIRASSTSIAVVPLSFPATELSDSLCAALRIDTLMSAAIWLIIVKMGYGLYTIKFNPDYALEMRKR